MDDIENDDDIPTFDINHNEDESDESESDDSPSPAQPANSPVARPAEAEVPADASFHNGFEVPEARRITRYLQIIQHFRQREILHQSFMRSFGNGSFMSSHS